MGMHQVEAKLERQLRGRMAEGTKAVGVVGIPLAPLPVDATPQVEPRLVEQPDPRPAGCRQLDDLHQAV